MYKWVLDDLEVGMDEWYKVLLLLVGVVVVFGDKENWYPSEEKEGVVEDSETAVHCVRWVSLDDVDCVGAVDDDVVVMNCSL